MWEMFDSNKKPREFHAKYSNNKACGLCKTFFRPNDKFYIIIIPSTFRGSHKRLKENMFVHVDEWDEICKGVTTDKELADKIISSKFKKCNELNNEEANRLAAFKTACIEYGFIIETRKSYGCKMRKNGSSIYIEYNAYMDSMKLNYRGKKGLFDSFYEKQIITNIYNKMHEILKDGKYNDYDYKQDINNIFKEVNKTMNEIFN